MTDLSTGGYAIAERVLSPEALQRLSEGLATADEAHAIRNLLDHRSVRDVAASPAVRRMVDPVLGARAFAVRALYFDKLPRANWKVIWHQDLSIALRERAELPGFRAWTRKAGVVHVQPPSSVLEKMLAVRIHLDDCGPSDGPLRVIPGTHRFGRLSSERIQDLRREITSVSCLVGAGGAVILRPLILHASSAATTPRRRRVVHIEFAGEELPAGIEWHDRVPSNQA